MKVKKIKLNLSGLIILFANFLGAISVKVYQSYEVPPTKPFEGPLALNNKLASSEKLYDDGSIFGPEHILFINDTLYTGVAGQGFIKIVDGKIEHVVNFGVKCGVGDLNPKCGRILNHVQDKKDPNQLIVVDGYYGIFFYNLVTGKSFQIVSPHTLLDSYAGPRPAKFFNSVAVAENGDIYWTSSSANYNLRDLGYIFFDDPNGRVFRYDRYNKKHILLLDQVAYPAGIALSPGEKSLIVAAVTTGELIEIYLKGPKAGKAETFLDGIGGGYNIVPDEHGFWLAVPVWFDTEHLFVAHILSKLPKVRQYIIDLLSKTETELLEKGFSKQVNHEIEQYIGSVFHTAFQLSFKGAVLRIDWHGNIVKALFATDGSLTALTTAVPYKGYLYVSSAFNSYIARYKLEDYHDDGHHHDGYEDQHYDSSHYDRPEDSYYAHYDSAISDKSHSEDFEEPHYDSKPKEPQYNDKAHEVHSDNKPQEPHYDSKPEESHNNEDPEEPHYDDKPYEVHYDSDIPEKAYPEDPAEPHYNKDPEEPHYNKDPEEPHYDDKPYEVNYDSDIPEKAYPEDPAEPHYNKDPEEPHYDDKPQEPHYDIKPEEPHYENSEPEYTKDANSNYESSHPDEQYENHHEEY